MNHLLVSIVENKFLRLPKPVEIIVPIVLSPCMWMARYPEIEPLIVEKQCILSHMKSKMDEWKYSFNVKHAENFIETKELMMMRWKI